MTRKFEVIKRCGACGNAKLIEVFEVLNDSDIAYIQSIMCHCVEVK